MKYIVGLLLFIGRLFCGYKIVFWLFEKIYYKNNLPISEIEPFLVFILFDVWVITMIKNTSEEF